MCGIIGALGRNAVADSLVEALKRLEYRGYDSAGVAVLEAGAIRRRRTPGKIANLVEALREAPLTGAAGIGHTRWATHGAPTEANAHPHATDHVAIVHNGIIENFRELRDELEGAGRRLTSQTDTEVIVHLVSMGVEAGLSPLAAVQGALARLRGAFAIVCLFANQPDLLIGARRGSPLVVGLGEGEAFFGSDAVAVAPLTQTIIYLEEGDVAEVTRAARRIFDAAGAPVERPAVVVSAAMFASDRGNHRHFMHKEIHEQPEILGRVASHYIDALERLPAAEAFAGLGLSSVRRLWLIGCGTAHYAGRVGEYWLERIAGVSAECDIASEFRYREPALGEDEAAVFISQSGETADTLAALRYCKQHGVRTIAIVNVPQSSIWREADLVLPTLAGPEIGVASTKAFTAQLGVLAALAVHLGRERGRLSEAEARRLCASLLEAPRLLAETLAGEDAIARLAQDLEHSHSALYMGRGPLYPLALEGALKLKELSYIHAEGYAAGELKHGPIALIDERMPIVVLAPHDPLFEKTMSNMQEIAARRGRIVAIADDAALPAVQDVAWRTIRCPALDPFIAPLVLTGPLQLLAYHVALARGADVDQPRNLAKSVTVE